MSCARRSVDSPAVDPALAATIADVEAGRANTPLVTQPGAGSEATVTFLVKSTGEQTPRIVSDVTGWGESPDESLFNLTVGEMTNIGSTGWHRLETTVVIFLDSYLPGDPDNHEVPPVRMFLTRAGHDVIWIEVPEGHNPTTWRDHLGDVLVSLFGSGEPSAP